MAEIQPVFATEAQLADLYHAASSWVNENGALDISESRITGTYLGIPIVEECAAAIDFAVSYQAVARYAPDVVETFKLSPSKAVDVVSWQACYFRNQEDSDLHDDFSFDAPSVSFRLYGSSQSPYYLQSLRVHKESTSPTDTPTYCLSRNNDVRTGGDKAYPEYIDHAKPGEYGALLQTEHLALTSLVQVLQTHSPRELQDPSS